MTNPAVYIKAILAFLIAGLGGIATAAQDGGVSMAEALSAVVAALVALGAVYQIPNAPNPEADA